MTILSTFILDCPHGTYGNNCKQLCSNNCYKNSCDGYTGKCTHGCLTGYVPPNCQKSEKYYGNN